LGWKQIIIEKLRSGETVKIRGHGNSMTPRFKNGDKITLAPITESPKVGDAVFCKVGGNIFTHLITAIQGERFQISNNHGHVNGWITVNAIYGKSINVERK
jgi:phage repressor protein C with HTH and peptisase S24 domain